MKVAATLSIFAAALALASCNVFLDDIGDLGNLGEPCSKDGTCYDDLVCIDDTCSERVLLGESCAGAMDIGDVCADEHWCLNDICVSAGGPYQPCRLDSSDHTERCQNIGTPPCDENLSCLAVTDDPYNFGLSASCVATSQLNGNVCRYWSRCWWKKSDGSDCYDIGSSDF